METAPRFRFLPQTPLARGVALVCLLLAAAIIGFALWRGLLSEAAPSVGGPFALTDQFGKPRTDADFRGQYMLVFFGFTHCPDVCPIELQTISDALDQLDEKQSAKITPIFITVDPDRDTPEVMRSYVANFHPRMVALTGSAEAIGTVAKSYRVFYARATGTNAPPDPAAYILDHSAVVYLMGPDGAYVTHFSPGTSAQAMAADLRDRL
ncbi:MAG TPA: SCO family protein [Candidatus Acidoferrum sp.]|nr:SCO family protein [Candidatus Acidoferrum sp.]